MGANDMPYLYTPTTNRSSQIAYPYSDFNPKAVTQASYARLAHHNGPQHKKKEGPLINFNQHPDSYVVFTGSQQDHKPLHKGAKKAIVTTRWVQFALRILQEIVALGLLTCTICITSVDGAQKYLLRIPQAWDSLIGLYAIYHLSRPAKSRTAGSSASYHIFALIMDVCLIPLYIYIIVITNNNRGLPVEQKNTSGRVLSGDWRWTSFFDTNATDLLLLVTFIAAVVIAGLHFISCGIGLYLAMMFKKIANLPPDMNPLEDNLTSRRAAKHASKNSEWTLTSNRFSNVDVAGGHDMAETREEAERKKTMAHLSGSTLSVGQYTEHKNATMESLLPPTSDRMLPFSHTRNDSKTSLAYSPHNPNSARLSRQQYEGHEDFYSDAISNPRNSRYEVRDDGRLQVRSRGDRSASPPKRNSATLPFGPNTPSGQRENRNSFLDSFEIPETIASSPETSFNVGVSNGSPQDKYETARVGSPGRLGSPGNSSAPNFSLVQREQKNRLLDDNWYVLDEHENGAQGQPSRQQTPALLYREPNEDQAGNMQARGRHDSFEHVDVVGRTGEEIAPAPKPLDISPPSPEPEDEPFSHLGDNSGVGRSLTVYSAATQTSSIYSESAPPLYPSTATSSRLPPKQSSSGRKAERYARRMDGNVTPKGRYYGDLAAATRGIRNSPSVHIKTPLSENGQPYGYGRPQGRDMLYDMGTRNPERDGLLYEQSFPPPPPPPEKNPERQTRVISRSGADIADQAVFYVPEKDARYGVRSRRDVSGKVAEEGRGGAALGWSGRMR